MSQWGKKFNVTLHKICKNTDFYWFCPYTEYRSVKTRILSQTSKMEGFAKIVDWFQTLTFFATHSNLNVWQSSEYASEVLIFTCFSKPSFSKIYIVHCFSQTGIWTQCGTAKVMVNNSQPLIWDIACIV